MRALRLLSYTLLLIHFVCKTLQEGLAKKGSSTCHYTKTIWWSGEFAQVSSRNALGNMSARVGGTVSDVRRKTLAYGTRFWGLVT